MEVETGSSGAALRMETKASLEENVMAQSLVRTTVAAEESTTVGRDRTTQKTSSIEDAQQRLSGLRLEGTTRRTPKARTQKEQNDGDSQKPAARPNASKEPAGSSSAPFTPLDYKMADDAFQAAKAAPEGSTESFWSYSLFRGPGDEGKVKVHYAKTAVAAERALQYLLDEKYLGLDLEWVMDANRYSGARKNVSLLQLASQSRVVLLHIALYPAKDELATPTLRKILTDPAVTKVGVWIKGDCTKLRNWLDIDTQSMFELSHLFKQVKYSASGQHELVNKRLVSLADQVQETMGLPLKKSQDVRLSDWSQPLDIDQIRYSASDAYAAVQLFAMLNHKREQLNPTPALPFHADLNKPIPLPPEAESSSSEEAAVEYEAAVEEEAAVEDEAAVEYEAAVDDEADVEEEVADGGELEAEDDFPSLAELTRDVLQLMRQVRQGLAGFEEEDSEGQPDTSSIDTTVAKPEAAAARQPRAPPKATSPPKALPSHKDPRVIAAETWLAEYKEDRGGQLKATLSALKAYHLWHANADLEVDHVAQLLRDPPLQPSTVASYILTSLKSENLPYDKERLKTGVLAHMPRDILKRRAQTIAMLLGDGTVP